MSHKTNLSTIKRISLACAVVAIVAVAFAFHGKNQSSKSVEQKLQIAYIIN